VSSIFFSYSHVDEDLRDQLEKQLAMLKRQGMIDTWHDRRIPAGSDFGGAISEQIELADIILLLISPDFLASDYCYDREMLRAMERHTAGEAKVIPVILRPCDWHHAPFGKLLAIPRDGKPVTQWSDRDEAFLEVSKAIRELCRSEGRSNAVEVKSIPSRSSSRPMNQEGPRSSNLRLKKEFTDRDKDRFKTETFDFMAKFFENSLGELEERNEGIECEFRKLDANRFTASIYKFGNSVAKCTVFMGGDRYLGEGISFIHGETSSSSSYNESLQVGSDDLSMFLTAFGASFRNSDKKLSQRGASEMYWAMLIQPLQSNIR